jgi:hypothetical protein
VSYRRRWMYQHADEWSGHSMEEFIYHTHREMTRREVPMFSCDHLVKQIKMTLPEKIALFEKAYARYLKADPKVVDEMPEDDELERRAITNTRARAISDSTHDGNNT